LGSREVKVHQVAIKVAHRIISAHQGKIEAEQKSRDDRSIQTTEGHQTTESATVAG
jgi:hypothetical protein